jgi:hypothetical protein
VVAREVMQTTLQAVSSGKSAGLSEDIQAKSNFSISCDELLGIRLTNATCIGSAKGKILLNYRANCRILCLLNILLAFYILTNLFHSLLV